MARIGFWAGTAGFALGLSLAGLYSAEVASADSSQTDAAKTGSSASAGPARNPAKARNRPTPARGHDSTVKPAAVFPARRAPFLRREQRPRLHLGRSRFRERPPRRPSPRRRTAPVPNRLRPPCRSPFTTTRRRRSIWVYKPDKHRELQHSRNPVADRAVAPAPPPPAGWVGQWKSDRDPRRR